MLLKKEMLFPFKFIPYIFLNEKDVKNSNIETKNVKVL